MGCGIEPRKIDIAGAESFCRSRCGRSAKSADNADTAGPREARRNRRPVGEGSARLRGRVEPRRVRGAPRGAALPDLGRLRRHVRERLMSTLFALDAAEAAATSSTVSYDYCMLHSKAS